jgi:hypothetical protein
LSGRAETADPPPVPQQPPPRLLPWHPLLLLLLLLLLLICLRLPVLLPLQQRRSQPLVPNNTNRVSKTRYNEEPERIQSGVRLVSVCVCACVFLLVGVCTSALLAALCFGLHRRLESLAVFLLERLQHSDAADGRVSRKAETTREAELLHRDRNREIKRRERERARASQQLWT